MIPRTIHQIWTGSPVPAVFEAWAEGWRELHPGWSYILWRECPTDFEVYPLWRDAELIVAADRVGQFRSDVLRYELLLRHGGVYVDMDFEPRKPLDGIVEGLRGFAAFETDARWIGNAIIGADAGSPLMREVIRRLPGSVEKYAGRTPGVVSGPQHLTRVADRLSARELDGFRILASRLFYPYRYDELDRAGEDFPDAICIHRWAHKARLAT